MSKFQTVFFVVVSCGLLLSAQIVWSFPLNNAACMNEVTFQHEKTSRDKDQNKSKGADDVKLIHRVDAAYPQDAREKGIEGKVVVEFLIDEKGEVNDITVKDGPELFS